MDQKATTDSFERGTPLGTWVGADYHAPAQRGWGWLGVFAAVGFGLALWRVWADDWVLAFTILVVMGLYLFHHRQGYTERSMGLYTGGIAVGNVWIAKEQIEGFWCVYHETASVLNLELRQGKRVVTRRLHMGDRLPEWFRVRFTQMGVPEQEEKQESVVDTWIRALKL